MFDFLKFAIVYNKYCLLLLLLKNLPILFLKIFQKKFTGSYNFLIFNTVIFPTNAESAFPH